MSETLYVGPKALWVYDGGTTLLRSAPDSM